MTRTLSLFLVLIFLSITNCNIWDNVYSQSEASTPIIISESTNINFILPQYKVKGNVDYNNELGLLSAKAEFDLAMLSVQIARIQLDIATLTLTVVRAGRSGCENYRLQALTDVHLNGSSISQSSLFFVNLLFRFIGKENFEGIEHDKYQFDPFLFGRNIGEQFQVLADIPQEKSDDKTEEKTEDSDGIEELKKPDVEIQLYLLVDPFTGNIKKVTEGFNENDFPIELVSRIKEKMFCDTQVEIISNEDVRRLMQTLYQNRGQLGKYLRP